MRLTHIVLVSALVIVGVVVLAAGQTGGGPAAGAGKVRIGVYDNRAIAVAYAASEFNPVKEKMTEMEAAKKAGDEKKMAELREWGREHQQMLHFQGFSRVPVEDLLEPVKGKVAKVAEDMKLAAITAECTYTAANVEVVDVTDELVELYQPSERTRKMAKMICGAKAEKLTTVADLPAEQ